MNFLRNTIHYFFLPIVVLLFFFGMLKIKKKARLHRKNKNLFFTKDRYTAIYKMVKKALYIKNVKLIYEKNVNYSFAKPILFVCNHKSNIDPLLIFKILYELCDGNFSNEFIFISKIENKKNKRSLTTSALDLLNTIFLDRTNVRQQFLAFQEQIDIVNSGKSIVIFPEGTRIYDDTIGEFKPAAFKIAYKCYSQIQPIMIFGSSGLMDNNKKYKNKNKKVIIKFLNLIKPNNFINTEEVFLAENIREKIEKEYLLLLNKNKY
ncbi:MAG: 1-acyl-sn-glycerol-3-phosphate acyltransferase [Mycoplasmataceae bacterium]|jgi:1-acyl-sn-glycerol-3-phosphate acyltransferase|nr:1-acyl-sn-glycerol-3-phosphate acyltransferase [Mycoplasmataceae bacterium]